MFEDLEDTTAAQEIPEKVEETPEVAEMSPEEIPEKLEETSEVADIMQECEEKQEEW